MPVDVHIASALDAMMRRLETPAVPLRAIVARARQPRKVRPRTALGVRAATVAAAALVAMVAISPARTLGWMRAAEEGIARVLHWSPPPPPSKSLATTMVPRYGTLEAAQRRVSFRIVPPAGLPPDVTRERIWTTPTLVYSKVTHRWSKGDAVVTFSFDRLRGRTFTLLAERFDPRFGPPPAYVFEDDSTGGRMLVKHRHFAWRNGDQMMSANQDQTIGAAEIEAVRKAMAGIPLPEAVTAHELNEGTLERLVHVGEPGAR